MPSTSITVGVACVWGMHVMRGGINVNSYHSGLLPLEAFKPLVYGG